MWIFIGYELNWTSCHVLMYFIFYLFSRHFFKGALIPLNIISTCWHSGSPDTVTMGKFLLSNMNWFFSLSPCASPLLCVRHTSISLRDLVVCIFHDANMLGLQRLVSIFSGMTKALHLLPLRNVNRLRTQCFMFLCGDVTGVHTASSNGLY